MIVRRTISIVCLAAAAAFTGCGVSGPDDFTLIQAKPELQGVDLGATGTSKGDEKHFEAAVTRDGEPVGKLLGQLTVRDVPDAGGTARVDESDLVFRLKDGDLFATGIAEYSGTDWRLTAQKPVRRAILGGTGAYAGARGELVTTLRSDGTYEQRFSFSG
ncbi:unannotated protein [freshwater metagenome]|uniref:Unannotated protein n=1 Tax=freshwater metagenome TaxID=449393 RepID=A0A6J7IAI4_9ZZZZ|nr:hypothetical protein [Actinomycetota bacterium]